MIRVTEAEEQTILIVYVDALLTLDTIVNVFGRFESRNLVRVAVRIVLANIIIILFGNL